MKYNENSLYTREDLLSLGIYELRDLGRDVGVQSPTTLKKEVLVDKIISIIYGEIPRQVVGKGRGRPARNKEKPNKLFVSLVEKVEEPKLNQEIIYSNAEIYGVKDLLSTKVASSSKPYVNDADSKLDSLLKNGVVCVEDDKYFIRKLKFIKTDNDCVIPKKLFKDYGLKENDRLDYLADAETNELLQIFKVNGEYATRKKESDLSSINNSREILVNNFKIVLNGANLIYSETNQSREYLVDSFCSWFDNLEYNTVKVCFNRNNFNKSDNMGVVKAEIYASCIGDEYETMAMIEEGIDKVSLFSLLNNKAVLILDDLAWLIKVVESYPKSIYGNFVEKMVKTCKNANVTLVCVCSHLNNEKIKELASIFDSVN